MLYQQFMVNDTQGSDELPIFPTIFTKPRTSLERTRLRRNRSPSRRRSATQGHSKKSLGDLMGVQWFSRAVNGIYDDLRGVIGFTEVLKETWKPGRCSMIFPVVLSHILKVPCHISRIKPVHKGPLPLAICGIFHSPWRTVGCATGAQVLLNISMGIRNFWARRL